ncbi:MAG: hypothetical protein ACO1OB_32945 [Archangium sp.]
MRALLFAVVVLVGCSKKPPAEVVDAGAPPKPVERELLKSASTLSVFDVVDGSCVWRQEDPVAKKTVELAKFDGNCVGVQVAWSIDITRAIVAFDPQLVQTAGYSSTNSTPPAFADEAVDAKAKPRWFLVDLNSGTTEALTMPTVEKSELRDFGIMKNGDVVAMLEETLPEDAKGTIKSADKTFDLSTLNEGIPVLVHAYKRDGAKWTRFETELSTTGWDYGLGTRALEMSTELGPKSDTLLDSISETDTFDDATQKQLEKFKPAKAKTEDDGAWTGVEVDGTVISVWQVSGEFAHNTGLAVTSAGPLPELGFTDGDLTAYSSNGPFLLISKSDVGTHPRMYSFPGAKRVFASDSARGVTFWPRASAR